MCFPSLNVFFTRNRLFFLVAAISIAFALIISRLLPIFVKLQWFSIPEESLGTGTVLCRPKCRNESFSLPGMLYCHPWLNCKDISTMKILQEIGAGAVKKINMGIWNEYAVAVATPVLYNNSAMYETDFRSGLESFQELGHNDRLVQLLGFCKNPLTVVTEYHKFGNSARFLDLLRTDRLQRHDVMWKRFQLCLDYVEILAWLHATPDGPRVMCDSSSLDKTLQQYLLTDDLRLRLNDVDALPRVRDGVPIQCGRRELTGDFVAPEQRWPFPEREFDDRMMPPYDEKTDIWKIPEVCGYFVSGARDEDLLRHHLFNIHKKCKSRNPAERPTAERVLGVYRVVFARFKSSGS